MHIGPKEHQAQDEKLATNDETCRESGDLTELDKK